MSPEAEPLLAVDELRVSFPTERGTLQAVDGVSFTLATGEILAVVGESGCGKSVTAMTLLGLTRREGASVAGSAQFAGIDLIAAGDEELRRIRGAEIAMIFQDPMRALNPVLRVGDQVAEQIRAHEDVSARDARARAVEMLTRAGIPSAATRARSYPHELSGGMRQRVMIAMALSCSPRVLLADEPTTALDVTTQAQILSEIKRLRDDDGLGVVLVTHDLGVVADVADRVAVMYAGRVVEEGTLDEIFYDPQHPYTWGLLNSIARLDRPRTERLPAIPGSPPSLQNRPAGCHFRPRCPHEFASCSQTPALAARLDGSPGHLDRCLLEPEEKRHRREVTA